MHIKFTKHGSGSTVKAVRYLLQKQDSKGEVRKRIEILEGIPELFASTCDSLPYSRHYASAVLTWDSADFPTDSQIFETFQNFKEVALGGVNAPVLAIRHDDHLHVLIGRVDLDSGKSFNPAPPGWQTRFDPLRDMLNYKYDWSRPDDPMRQRMTHLQLPEKMDRKNVKQQISDWLEVFVDNGFVKNRDDVLTELKKMGEITRVGCDYVSIRLPDFEKPIRLKGRFFEESFKADDLFLTPAPYRCGVFSEEERWEKYESAKADFEKVLQNVRAYNEKRYPKVEVLGDLDLPIPKPRKFESFKPVKTEAPTPTFVPVQHQSYDVFVVSVSVSVTVSHYPVLSEDDWKKLGYFPENFEAGPPSIYQDKYVKMTDFGDKLSFSPDSNMVGAGARAIAGAIAKGWNDVEVTGSDAFIKAVFQAAKDQNFVGKINGVEVGLLLGLELQ
jgi:hypothetical protein